VILRPAASLLLCIQPIFKIVTRVLVLSTCSFVSIFAKALADGDIRPVFQKASAKILPHLQIESSNAPIGQKGFELLPRRGCRTHFRLLNRAAGWPRISKISPERAPFLHLASIVSCSESLSVDELSDRLLGHSSRAKSLKNANSCTM